jgi:hypothetical protein
MLFKAKRHQPNKSIRMQAISRVLGWGKQQKASMMLHSYTTNFGLVI